MSRRIKGWPLPGIILGSESESPRHRRADHDKADNRVQKDEGVHTAIPT